MKNVTILILITACFYYCSNSKKVNNLTASNFERAKIQYTKMLDVIGWSNKNPRTIDKNGDLKLVKSKDWTSGFFPGGLWYLYEYTKDEKWRKSAEHFTNNIKNQQYNGSTHDMGFKMFCSFGNGYRLTNNDDYKTILITSAKTLSTRFNPVVGCIRSWDHNSDRWQYPVIIDNMMNLELLFWATKVTGDSTFFKIADAHAQTTLKNHFREDYSSWHVINYDTLTGQVLDRNTHQGYADESSWARGQAWGLYGFTMVFRETGNPRYLDQANKIAQFILKHKNLPADLVPYWDFDAPDIPDAPRDVSAAAIICSALYELQKYAPAKRTVYLKAADKILNSLSSEQYLARPGENNNFLLKHALGHMPKKSEIDVPIIYADYYFLEANLRRLGIRD
jgi:unsaturated chondroitin disaccharide hydrolase